MRGTLSRPVKASGPGLHTGRRCRLEIEPAPPGTGIVFRREGDVPALLEFRYEQRFCTALKSADGEVVRTTEHLMSALMACGIDDAVIKLSREEVPVLDGSALPWVKLFADAGRSESTTPRRYVEVLKPLELSRDTIHHVRIEPSAQQGLEVDVTMGMKDLGMWHWEGSLTPARFIDEMACARTFGRLKYLLPGLVYGLLKGIPIVRGARPWNGAGIIGKWVVGGRRMENEFVFHKLVDMLGDMYLVGAPVIGKITALRPTHTDNYLLMKTLMDTPDAWRWVEQAQC